MRYIGLDELEAIMLQRRLQFLRDQGVTARLTYLLGDNFFELMEDHWTFCSALSDIYAAKEMSDQERDEAVGAALPQDELYEDYEDEDDGVEIDEKVREFVQQLEADYTWKPDVGDLFKFVRKEEDTD